MARNANGGERGFHVFATKAAYWVGNQVGVPRRPRCDRAVAHYGPVLPVLRYLAAHYQYRHDCINTGTTVVTFLVVFLIQNTQNRDARAIHLKLDEIIKSIDQAQNEMIDIEHLSDDELQRLADRYQKVREECDNRSSRRKKGPAKEN
jgi:hypothetical protein